jgi:hypothetical protein
MAGDGSLWFTPPHIMSSHLVRRTGRGVVVTRQAGELIPSIMRWGFHRPFGVLQLRDARHGESIRRFTNFEGKVQQFRGKKLRGAEPPRRQYLHHPHSCKRGARASLHCFRGWLARDEESARWHPSISSLDTRRCRH